MLAACDRYGRTLARNSERFDKASPRLADAITSAATHIRHSIDVLTAALHGKHHATVMPATDFLDAAETFAREHDADHYSTNDFLPSCIHYARSTGRLSALPSTSAPRTSWRRRPGARPGADAQFARLMGIDRRGRAVSKSGWCDVGRHVLPGVSGGCRLDGLVAKGYRLVARDQQFLLPENMRDWLPVSDPVWLVIGVVADLDTSGLHAQRRTGGAGRAAMTRICC